MISFSSLMRKVLNERMSFRDLYRASDPARVDRSREVKSKSLNVTSMDGNEAWTFSYKSNPSTTGQRWQGYVRFLKEDVSRKDRADQLECMVDCTCPDYRFRWAYNNAKQDAGALGPGAWNDSNGRPPRSREQGGVGDLGPGMCKHLISLGEYLKTSIEPEAPQPDDPKPEPKKTPVAAPTPTAKPVAKPQVTPPKPVPAPMPVAKKKPTTPTVQAPSPEDAEKDTRGYDDTDPYALQEGTGQLAEKMNNFVKTQPQFQVPYED